MHPIAPVRRPATTDPGREPRRPGAPSTATSAPGAPAPTGGAAIDARALTRIWGRGASATVALDGVDLVVAPGELVAVVGPSGSGKSTLGALLAGIDRPTRGSLVVGGERLDRLSEEGLARWRARNLGIVLQDFALIPTLTAAENVELGLDLAGVRRRRRAQALAALDRVGLARVARRLPGQLSGGEQQRVAVARALARRPALLVADEPTGALDVANGDSVFELIRAAADEGTTVVLITHDAALVRCVLRVVSLVDGRVTTDRRAP